MDYCVYKTTYTGKLLPPYYIGSTSLAKIERGYRGSVCSKKYKDIWESELREHPELFSTKVLVKCETRKEAFVVELEIQQEYDVVINPFYINQSFACKNGFINTNDVKGEKNPMFGIHRFGEDNPFFGRRHTEESKNRIADGWTERRKLETSERMKGIPKSIETIERMKGPRPSSRKPKNKSPCPHCGMLISNHVIARHIKVRHDHNLPN